MEKQSNNTWTRYNPSNGRHELIILDITQLYPGDKLTCYYRNGTNEYTIIPGLSEYVVNAEGKIVEDRRVS